MRVGQIIYSAYPLGSEDAYLREAKVECLKQITDGTAESEQILNLANAYKALREAEDIAKG